MTGEDKKTHKSQFQYYYAVGGRKEATATVRLITPPDNEITFYNQILKKVTSWLISD